MSSEEDDGSSDVNYLCEDEIATADVSASGWLAVLSDGTVRTGGSAARVGGALRGDSGESCLCASVGATHCCAVGSDGASVMCWDRSDDEDLVVPERPAWIGHRQIVVEVSCGHKFTLARTSELEVYAWGTETRGLGCGGGGGGGGRNQQQRRRRRFRGTTLSSARLVEGLVGVPVVRVAAGRAHACAVSLSGSGYAWGENRDGRCGVRRRRVLWRPRAVDAVLGPRERFRDAACGDRHSAFVLAPGGRVVRVGSPDGVSTLRASDGVAVSAAGAAAIVLTRDGSIERCSGGGESCELPDHLLRATFFRDDGPTSSSSLSRLVASLASPSVLAGSFLASPPDTDDSSEAASVLGDEASDSSSESSESSEDTESEDEESESEEARAKRLDAAASREAEGASFTDEETDGDCRAFSIDDDDDDDEEEEEEEESLPELEPAESEDESASSPGPPRRRWKAFKRLDATALDAALSKPPRDPGAIRQIARACRRGAARLRSALAPRRARRGDDDVGRCVVALWAASSTFWPARRETDNSLRRAALEVLELVSGRAKPSGYRRCATARAAAFARGETTNLFRRLAAPMRALLSEAAAAARARMTLPCGESIAHLPPSASSENDEEDDDFYDEGLFEESSSDDDFEELPGVFASAERAGRVLEALRAYAETRGASDVRFECEPVDRLGALVDEEPGREPRPGPLLLDFRRYRFADEGGEDDPIWFFSRFSWAYSPATRRSIFAVDEKARRDATARQARARLLADHAADAGLAWISPFFALLAASRDATSDAFADDGDVASAASAAASAADPRRDESRDVLREMMVAMTGGGGTGGGGGTDAAARAVRRAAYDVDDDDDDDDGGGGGGGEMPPRRATAPYFVVRARRGESMAHDALEALARASDEDLCRRELRVMFEGEPGVDEGGVKREFFELVSPQLFDPGLGMFVYVGDSLDQALYFNPRCDWYLDQYDKVGALCGLAFANGIPLTAARLPTVAFKKLLAWRSPPSVDAKIPLPELLRDLDEVDRLLSKGLRRLLEYEPKKHVERVYERAFVYGDPPVPLIPGGDRIPVTRSNRRHFVRLVATRVLHSSVDDQFSNFAKGFWRTAAKDAFVDFLQPEDFRDCCRGDHADLDWAALRRVTRYDGWPSDDPDASAHPVVAAFWDAVYDLDPSNARDFLKFITGSNTPPLGGLGALKPPEHVPFRLQRAGCDSDRLPTAHVCFHTLLLPDYNPPSKLAPLLKRAIKECEGFGLR
ncbi:hypothetical protein CTAYLR_001012 [Chrysophaeum taylorii]|uniref:HECT domain-containing protein n=1 Tax=Chrysophaeum taylorii TaxID=2483200 RepID=A0AAD7UFS9_9STRA|nr:hypothetical protein CTAYLR_001012 [Chrysophaeum taylorii]